MLGAVALARRTKKQKFSEQAAGGSSRSSSQPYHARNTASLAISISFQRGRSRHVARASPRSCSIYCDSDLSAAVCSAGKAQALTRLTNHGPTPSLPFGSVVRPAPAPPRRQRSYSPSPPSPVATPPSPPCSAPHSLPAVLRACALLCSGCHSRPVFISFKFLNFPSHRNHIETLNITNDTYINTKYG